MTTEASIQKYLLVDDDPVYTTIMERAAEIQGLKLETFPSLEDIGFVGLLSQFQGAILDCNLGVKSIRGMEIADYIESLNLEVPVIMVSNGSPPPDRDTWPNCICKFIHKSQGYQAIVLEMQKQVEESKKSSVVSIPRFSGHGYLG